MKKLVLKLKKYFYRFKWSFVNKNYEVLIHGFCDTENNEYWKEKFEYERMKYALENPWVLKYDFGHIEIIQKNFQKNI